MESSSPKPSVFRKPACVCCQRTQLLTNRLFDLTMHGVRPRGAFFKMARWMQDFLGIYFANAPERILCSWCVRSADYSATNFYQSFRTVPAGERDESEPYQSIQALFSRPGDHGDLGKEGWEWALCGMLAARLELEAKRCSTVSRKKQLSTD